MNPLTNVKNQNKINQRELELGLTNKKSWHDKYKDSAWIFTGGLPYDLTEGDVLCIFSQYGEIVNINLVRDQKTGKSKGFCFLCYEDQRSTILAVDNFNGAKILGRIMRVDHVEEYKKPKEHGDEDEITMKLRADGCAPKIESSPEPEDELEILPMPSKKVKKAKKEKKKKKKKKKESSSENSSESEDDTKTKKETKVKQEPGDVRVKKEKYDAGYDKALKGNVSGNKRHYSDSEDSEIDSKYSRSDVRSQRDQRNFDNNSERGQERQRNRNDINRTHDRDRNNDRRNIYEDRLDKGDRREEQRDRNNRADTRDRDERRGRDRDDKGGRDWDERRGRDREVEPRRDRDRSDRGYRR